MKKKIYMIALTVALACSVIGCGKKDGNDSKDSVRNEVVSFVNDDLFGIQGDRDEAVAIYNNYFVTEGADKDQFLADLKNTAIPKMESFVNNLTALETTSTEVAELKDLYLQGSQKQLEAMQKVAAAIEEENPDYLTEADTLIAESKSFFTQYESKLKLLSVDYSITINGSFGSATATDAQ